MDSYHSASTRPLYRGTQIVWYILGAVEVILLLRFFLKLFEANPSAGFSSFIYNISNWLTTPFASVFPTISASGSQFEWTTLLAMFVYWLVAYAIINLFLMSRSVSTPEAAIRLNRQDL